MSLALGGLMIPGARGGANDVLLVVQAASPVTELSSLAVRKLFLGLPVLVDGLPLRPIRNRSDARLDAIFLQQIVALSAEAYDRQLLVGMNRQGRVPPLEIRDRNRIRDLLEGDPYAVSFLWRHEAESDPELRILRVLWQG